MLHVRDTIAGSRGSARGLDPGCPSARPGAAPVGYPAVCGVYRPVRGHWAVRTSVVAHPGPQAAGPAHRARNDPPGGVGSRTSLLPSCAGTPRIRRDEGHKPTGRGGLGQGGRQPIRPGNRGVLPLATVIASVNGLRCLAEHVTKHPPARNHPTCDCCHDLLHRAAPVAVAIPTGRLVVRALTRHPGRALVPMRGRRVLVRLCAKLHTANEPAGNQQASRAFGPAD